MVYCKSSWKICSGKTNMLIIFFGDIVSQRTFEHLYDICPMKKFSVEGGVIGNN